MMNLPVKMIFNLIFFIIFLTVASTPTVILTIEEHNCSKAENEHYSTDTAKARCPVRKSVDDVFETRQKRDSSSNSMCSKINGKACVSYFTEYPDKNVETINTVPSSCKDLQRLGHQTSGFYLVKGINENVAKIDNVYCEFRWNNRQKNHDEDLLQPDVEELRHGYVDIHSSSRVFFYVQKSTTFSKTNSTIPFQIETLNEGNAMNLKSGIFTAKKSGMYHFSFVGIKDSAEITLAVYLRKNDHVIGQAMATNKMGSFTLSLTSTLKLKEGDRIDLYKTTGELYDDDDLYTHFTGWIIEEDLYETNDVKTEEVISKNAGNNSSTLPSFLFIMPSSCNDLQRLGHRLRGFYLAKGVKDNSKQIEIIYCDFKRNFFSKNSEKRYGYVDIYSPSRVFFYAQKTTSFNNENSTISFELATVNVGGAMNLSSGIFTAPKTGVYHFSFSGMKDSSDTELVIYLRKNGVNIAKALGSDNKNSFMASFSSTLNLNIGDTIDLYKTTGNLLDNAEELFTHFTGWIVEEELDITISIIPPTKSGNTKNAAKPYFPFSRYPDKEEGDKTFNDMPANCKDLQLIGYKFSGIYLVMKLENGNKSTKIEAIFCSFDQSDSEKNTEIKYGNVKIHSSRRPIFYVQKNTSFDMRNSIIPFEREILNIGNAMDLKSGVFTAPVSGFFHFSFTAVKERYDNYWHVVYLRKNRKYVGQAFATGYTGWYTTALSSTLKLKQGDEIDLYKLTGTIYDDLNGPYTHFTGWLIEEDYIIQ